MHGVTNGPENTWEQERGLPTDGTLGPRNSEWHRYSKDDLDSNTNCWLTD